MLTRHNEHNSLTVVSRFLRILSVKDDQEGCKRVIMLMNAFPPVHTGSNL